MDSNNAKPTETEILASILKEYLQKSQCATDDEQKLYLLALLGNKRAITTLRYRGSEHGWMAKDFHSRCDGLGPTISLFKKIDGDCIGGYTSAQWSSPDSVKYVGDSTAMLFNLSWKRHYPT